MGGFMWIYVFGFPNNKHNTHWEVTVSQRYVGQCIGMRNRFVVSLVMSEEGSAAVDGVAFERV